MGAGADRQCGGPSATLGPSMAEEQDPETVGKTEASADAVASDASDPSGPVHPAGAAPAAEAVRSRARVRWWWFLIAALVIEFWWYGRRGHIEVCVGKDGETDFALIGQERTDDNRWKFPRCESRENLGLKSHYEQAVDESLKVACRGATIFHHQGEGKACVAADKGWIHRIEVSHCPPWHKHFYEHLFWFL